MMRQRTSRIRSSLLALGLGLLAAGPVRSQSQTAPIAGLWRLNADLSDHMEDKLQDARRAGAYTGMAGGSMRGRGSGMRGKGDRPLEDQEMANLIYPVLQLLIRQDDSTVAISDAAGQMQTLFTDGRKMKEPLLTGADLETTARWKDGKLNIERKQDKAGNLKETYYIDPETRKLVLSVRMSSPTLLHTLEFRRVYDPATGN